MIEAAGWQELPLQKKLDRIEEEKQQRAAFQEVFSSPNGKEVYVWLANECGRFALDPRAIDPVLVGLINRLDEAIGIVHTMNFGLYAEAQLSIANVDDLVALGRAEQAKEGQ